MVKEPTVQQPQPVMALGQMLGEIAAIHQEQAALNRQQLEALCAQTEAQSRLLQMMLARPGSASPPPHMLSGVVLHKLTAEDDPQSFHVRSDCGGVPLAGRRMGRTAAPLTFGGGPDCSSWPAGLHSRKFPALTESRPRLDHPTGAQWLPLHVRPAAEGCHDQMAEAGGGGVGEENAGAGRGGAVHREADLAAAVTLTEDHLAVHEKDLLLLTDTTL